MSSTFSSSSREQLGVGVRARDERVQLVDADRLVLAGGRGDRDDLLGEHVERVARDDGRLDLALAHPPRDDRALEQVGAELREDAALADARRRCGRRGRCAAARGDRLRRLDLQHEVDGAHVDAELERGGRDQARQLARLQQLLDDRALLARQRAVVGAGDLASLGAVAVQVGVRQLVQPQREALGAAAVVDEHDRRGVLRDELAALAGRSPARSSGASPRRPATGSSSAVAVGACSGSTIDSTGTWICRSSGLRTPASTIRARAPRPDEEAADLLERVLRRRQADALRRRGRRPAARSSRSSVSARCEPRLVAATAWISSTITASTPARISRACEVSIR